MAFPMMPTAQWDVVRKMGPDELNKAAMGEYQAQGISPVFALARIKEETALAAAFQAQEQKQQQEEKAKMEGVPVGDIPFTVAEGMLRERGITGVDPSAGQEMPPEQMAALQGGIAGGQPPGMEGPPPGMEGPPMGMEGPPPMMGGPPPGMEGQPPMMAYGGGLIPRMAYGGLISDSRAYQQGGQIQDPLDAQGFMELFGLYPQEGELEAYNAGKLEEQRSFDAYQADPVQYRLDFPESYPSLNEQVRLPGETWLTTRARAGVRDSINAVPPDSVAVDQLPDSLSALDTDSLSTTAPPPVASPDSAVALPPTVAPSSPVDTVEEKRLAGVAERLGKERKREIEMHINNPNLAGDWEERTEKIAENTRRRRARADRSSQAIFGTDDPRENLPFDYGEYSTARYPRRFEPLVRMRKEIGWLENDRPKEEVTEDLSRAYRAILERSGGFRATAPTQDELMSDPSYKDAADEMTALGYPIPAWTELFEETAEAPLVAEPGSVGQPADQATEEEIMEAAGATFSPAESRVQRMFGDIDDLYISSSTYDPVKQDIDAEELRIKRQAIEDLDRLEDMRQAGIIDQIAYEDAKDKVREQVENTANLRFDEIEEEQRRVSRLGDEQISTLEANQAALAARAVIGEENLRGDQAARVNMSDEQISRLTADEAAALGISEAEVAQIKADQADRLKAATAQQALLGDIYGRRAILSAEQLEGHRALAADQDKAVRAQAGFAADATLFGGVGDVLRGDPRKQMFGDVIGAVGEIRGGELEDLMGIQTNLLKQTTKIQDELIAEERDVFEEIYSVGRVAQTGQEAATRGIGVTQRAAQASREATTAGIGVLKEGVQAGREGVTAGLERLYGGVQAGLENMTTQKFEIQNRVMDSQQTSSEEIYEMSQMLLNSKFLALEERRVLQEAINRGDVLAQREILAAHADFAKHANVIRAEVESMDEDALREKLALEIPATVDLARIEATERASQGATAAQERITRENLLADPKSWEALEQGHQHRIRDLEGQDWTDGDTVPDEVAAARMRQAVAGLEQQYSHLLRQQWDFLRRQGDALASQQDPTEVQTVITRLVASGMDERITTVEGASEWVSEQEVGLKGQMQRRSVENAAGLAEVLRRGRGKPPGWARTMPELYQNLLENDPDFTDPDSPLFGESQPMTGIRSIPHGSAGKGYGDTPLRERPREDRRIPRPGPLTPRLASRG